MEKSRFFNLKTLILTIFLATGLMACSGPDAQFDLLEEAVVASDQGIVSDAADENFEAPEAEDSEGPRVFPDIDFDKVEMKVPPKFVDKFAPNEFKVGYEIAIHEEDGLDPEELEEVEGLEEQQDPFHGKILLDSGRVGLVTQPAPTYVKDEAREWVNNPLDRVGKVKRDEIDYVCDEGYVCNN